MALQGIELLEANSDEVENRIDALLSQGEIVPSKSDWIQLPTTFRAEHNLARSLTLVNNGKSSLPSIHIDKALEWAQGKAGFQFAQMQDEALRQSLSSKVSILTGGPGTGKTTILRALVSILRAKKTKILLAAPNRSGCQKNV